MGNTSANGFRIRTAVGVVRIINSARQLNPIVGNSRLTLILFYTWYNIPGSIIYYLFLDDRRHNKYAALNKITIL